MQKRNQPSSDPPQKFYSVLEFAALLNPPMHPGSVTRLIRDGKLPAYKTASGKIQISHETRVSFEAARYKLSPANARMLDCVKKRGVRDHIETEVRQLDNEEFAETKADIAKECGS